MKQIKRLKLAEDIIKEILNEKIDYRLDEFFKEWTILRKMEDSQEKEYIIDGQYQNILSIYEDLKPAEDKLRERYPMCNDLFDYLKKKTE